MQCYSVSVKGILQERGSVLLRRNEREEFELVGGRLEAEDASLQARLRQEFLEETGIAVEVLEQREPWLYEPGGKGVIVIPFRCRALRIPETLEDQDGGTLHWVPEGEIGALPMPQGYRDSIRGAVPARSVSARIGTYFKIIPNYKETKFAVRIRVREGGKILMEEPLAQGCAPREAIRSQLGAEKEARLRPLPASADFVQETVVLEYSAE